MSEKLATGIGVPFPSLGSAFAGLADGYYYQLGLADPRTPSGWVSGPLLHDVNTGTFYQTASGVGSMSVLIAKQAGMTFDAISLTLGYTSVFSGPTFYGSFDLVNWTTTSPGSVPFPPAHLGMSYTTLGYTFHSVATYPYVALTFSDTSTPTPQAGCAEVLITNSGTEAGP